jgi:hypothetical protein
MPAGADVLATDELEGCEIGEYGVFCIGRREPCLCVGAGISAVMEFAWLLSACGSQRWPRPPRCRGCSSSEAAPRAESWRQDRRPDRQLPLIACRLIPYSY